MDSSGLLEAFLALRAGLLRYLAMQGASPDEAEDILQETSLKLSGGTFLNIDQPRAYLYRMVHNLFVLHRRSAGRTARRDEAWVGAHTGDPPEIDETPSAETTLIAREYLAILQETVDALPERTKFIFRRFRLDGVPQREIAAELAISLSAVEKHLTRAYEAIAAKRQKLDGAAGGSRHLKSKEGRS
ncbi:RNA polymerase sigma factor [Novosphingobium sp.]|uniref:RNA polymerase sigma factor n=1 Tax=Novosphingobium sp. TaxID=1874826 RepID=UPI002FE075E6